MREPPPRNQVRYDIEPDCSAGRGAPVVDTIASVSSALTGLMLIALISGFAHGDDDEDEAILYSALIFGTPTILYGVSAASGFQTVRECRAAIQDWYAMRAQMQFAPPQIDQPVDAPPAPAGGERGRCRLTAPACDPGLACASGFCVRPPGAP